MKAARLSAGFVVALGMLLGAPSSGLAQEPITWKWARFSPFEYALTGTAITGTVALQIGAETPPRSAWEGPIAFDGSAGNLLMLESEAGRRGASLASSVLLGGIFAYSLADAFVLSWLTSKSLDVASQLLLLDLQSFAVTSLLTESTKHLVRRQRSSNRRCQVTRVGDVPCDQGTAHESFFSGHASMAFTAAGLICARHRALPLYGGGVWDDVACGASLAVASAVGILRVASNAHYMSDVVVGAGVGLASGYLLPTLLHFERPRARSRLLVSALWSEGPFIVAVARW